jgi:hypothetical protein
MLFDELAKALGERQPLPPLCPTRTFGRTLSIRIESVSDELLFDNTASTPQQQEMRAACRAGLFLWNDDLENSHTISHTISQSIETPTGSFWHAILHRREGDFSNSNYWWRKTGEHPAFADVYARVLSTPSSDADKDTMEFLEELRRAGAWQPMAFVALCRKVNATGASTRAAQEIQRTEMTALLDWCRARI